MYSLQTLALHKYVQSSWKRLACILAALGVFGIPINAESFTVTFSFSGSPTGPPTQNGTTLTLDGLATGSILSNNPTLNAAWNPVTNHTHDVIDLLTGINNGSFSMTFSDGSTVSGTILEDDSQVLVGGGTGPFTQTLTFNGGTGEFLGVTGSITGSGFATPAGFSSSGGGLLNAPLVPEPASGALFFGGCAVLMLFWWRKSITRARSRHLLEVH
jgi:hypothetical protein